MSRANIILTNFTSGEWSPALRGRVDHKKYYNACETLENMICRPHGPAFRRPGTYFVQESLGRDHVTNGIFAAGTWTLGTGWTIAGGFGVGAAGTASDISQDPADLIEGETYQVIWTLSARTAGTLTCKIGGTSGTAQDTNGTFTEEIVCGATTVIAFTKSAEFGGKIDNVFVRQVAPVTRLESFEFSTVQAYILAFTDQNLRIFKDNALITSGGVAYEVSTPYAAEDLFELKVTQSADIMYIWHPEYPEYQLTRTGHTSWTMTATTFSGGPFEEALTTTGITPSATTGAITLTSTDDIFLETDEDRIIQLKPTGVATWAAATGYVAGNIISYNGIHYICIAASTGNTPPNSTFWEEVGKDGWYWLTITAFTTEKIVTATVSGDDLPNTNAITTYRLGTFCSELGYPSCGDFYEERLIRAGSTEYPQTIWASASGDYDDMEAGTNDDDAFVYTIAAKGVNPIQWICPQNVLLVGTVGAEWKISSGSAEAPLTVSSISAKRQSTWGSMNMQALLVNDVALFVQRAGTKVRELTEDPNSVYSKYVSPDLTILAEHITESGIIDMAYQQEPASVLWCVRDDGVLATMTYERTQEVVGWHRQITDDGDDLFESVAIITTTTEDEVWVCVNRTINSVVRRYIEYFKPWDWGTDRTDCFFVDSGLTSDGGDAVVITGITQADPGVVTSTAHGLTDGQFVKILDVVGMTEVNERYFIVASSAANTFELTDESGDDVDTSVATGDFSAYVSGGTAQVFAKDYDGLDHLVGETLDVLADGGVVASQEVNSDGEITLDDYANKVHVGIPITWKLQPMNIEAGASAGTAQGKIKRVHKLSVRFQDTMACQVGPDTDNLEDINFSSDSDPADEPIPLFTGDKSVKKFPGGYGDGTILLTGSTPLPCTVVAIMPELKTNDMV